MSRPVVGQERAADGPSVRFAALDELDASYRRQLHDLECRRIADLANLAEKAPAPEADAAYRQLFGLAIARELCREAQTAATRCLASTSSGRDVRAPAALVQVLSRTDKGEHDQALDDWKNLLRESARGADAALDADLALAVGEALLQRLIREGRYDVARRLCGLACADVAPAAIRDHFQDRMARLNWLGKPAPAIVATDVDGKPVSLAELKGRVVLVDFWATWCPPCVASIPALSELARKYHDRGFVILGVNVDAMHEDVQEMKKALPAVRRFLVAAPRHLDQPPQRPGGRRLRVGLRRRGDPGQLPHRPRRQGRRGRAVRRRARASGRRAPSAIPPGKDPGESARSQESRS